MRDHRSRADQRSRAGAGLQIRPSDRAAKEARPAITDGRASLRRKLVAWRGRGGGARHHRADSGRARRKDQGSRPRARHRYQRLRDRRCAAQRGSRGQGRGAHSRMQRRAPDEGQPAHRRAHAGGNVVQHRTANRAAHQPCLCHGCADLPGDPVHHRCGHQHLSRISTSSATSSRTQSISSPMSVLARRALPSCPRSRPSPRKFRRRSKPPLCARWPTAGK